MIDKQLANSLKASYSQKEQERRQIIRLSNEILFESKKSIFSLQRENQEIAQAKLIIMEKSLKDLEKKFGANRLQQEGAYQAAVEEFIEAYSLEKVISGKKIKKITGLNITHESYLGGICDLIGELVRYATNQAAKGNFDKVLEVKKQAEETMACLIDFDFTGYLRTKYDQARGHLRKLEQIAYDLRIRANRS